MYNEGYNQKYNSQIVQQEDVPVAFHLRETMMGRVGHAPAWISRPIRWKYGAQPYNRIAEISKLPIVAHLHEGMRGYISIGANYRIQDRYNERMKSRLRLTAGVLARAHLSEALTGSAHGFTGVRIREAAKESLQGLLRVSVNIYILNLNAQEALAGDMHLGADILARHKAAETLAGDMHMGADIYILQNGYETLNGYVNAGNVVEHITDIAGAIPPGGVLIIDSDNYNVLLNGSDAIEQHCGEWVWVSRPTRKLTLSTLGSGDLEWEVFYVARYL